MNKNRIRLTESQLHRVIKESVRKVLKEGKINNYGFLGVINNDEWDFFETYPRHCSSVYALTEEGYDVFYSWNEEGGYDYDENEIFEMLTTDRNLSRRVA